MLELTALPSKNGCTKPDAVFLALIRLQYGGGFPYCRYTGLRLCPTTVYCSVAQAGPLLGASDTLTNQYTGLATHMRLSKISARIKTNNRESENLVQLSHLVCIIYTAKPSLENLDRILSVEPCVEPLSQKILIIKHPG